MGDFCVWEMKKPQSSDWTAVNSLLSKGYAVFLPMRSAMASTSQIGKLVIFAVTEIDTPSFMEFSAISTL